MIARVSEATLKNIGKYIIRIHNKWWYNHNKMQHNKTVCIFCQIYCIFFFIWYGIYCLIVTYVFFYISSIFRVSSLQFHTSGIALLILTIFFMHFLFYWIVAIDIYPIILAQCTLLCHGCITKYSVKNCCHGDQSKICGNSCCHQQFHMSNMAQYDLYHAESEIQQINHLDAS